MEKEKLIALVQGVQQGDPDAATALYDGVSRDLYYHIRKTVEDQDLAEDLLQETFIEIFQTIDKLQEPAAFVTWSRQIAYHKCTAHFRKRHELLADENEDGYSVFDTVEEERTEFIPHEALDKEDLKDTIRGIISELPPEQRSAIMMRYFEELSVADIAKVQDVSEGTVKSRLNYGRKAIKEAVKKYEKKNGIKLHSVAILPLILWYFRQLSTGSASAAGGAAAVSGTLEGAKVAAAATKTAAAGAKSVAAQGAKQAAKKTAKGAAARFIAGIAATAVASSLATATVMQRFQPAADPVSTTAATVSRQEQEQENTLVVDNTAPEDPLALPAAGSAWVGFGEAAGFTRWFDMTLTSVSETQISGNLKLTYGAKTDHDTTFSGSGTASEDKITYTITLAKPHLLSDMWEVTLESLDLVYDRHARTFTMDDQYGVILRDVADIQEQTLPTGTWTGMGSDDGYLGTIGEHLFNLVIDEHSTTAISGHLTVSYQGIVDHDTAFTGRCMPRDADGTFSYDIVLETTRTAEAVIAITVEDLILTYDPGTDTFSITGIQFYDVIMEKA